MTAPEDPPYYILVSRSTPLASASATLSHPVIEYHYADDSPHSLLPRFPGEHILVIDYDPAQGASPTAKSLSADLAISGVKVTDAAGAGGLDEEHKMYILETTTMPEEIMDEEDLQAPHALLARFKHRNTIIRHALDYLEAPGKEPQSASSPAPAADSSPVT